MGVPRQEATQSRSSIGGLIALAVIGYVASVEKVRLDRASGGDWRVEVTIVHELVEFGTIPGDAQTF